MLDSMMSMKTLSAIAIPAGGRRDSSRAVVTPCSICATISRADHVKSRAIIGDSATYLVAHTAFAYCIARNGRLQGIGTWAAPQLVFVLDDPGTIAFPSGSR
jgi:hypothetical protein